MIWALLGVPMAAGAAAFYVRPDGPRRLLLLAAALAHAVLTAAAWLSPSQPALWGYLAMDAAGRLFLSVTSFLFLAAAAYAVGFLRSAGRAKEEEEAEGFLFDNAPEAVFTGCLLLFLGTMTMAGDRLLWSIFAVMGLVTAWTESEIGLLFVLCGVFVLLVQAPPRRLLALVGSSKALWSAPWPVLLLTGFGATATFGVLLDILGLGVLITGESGIGKSECAMDLAGRGHRIGGAERFEDQGIFVDRAASRVLPLVNRRKIGDPRLGDD